MTHDAPSQMHKPVPLWVRALVSSIALGVALYWFATVSGPYRWLVEFQLATVGRFWIMPTVSTVFVSTMACSVMVAEAVGALLPRRQEEERARAHAPGRRRGWVRWIAPVIAWTLGASLVSGGLWLSLYGPRAGAPEVVSLADLDAAQPSRRFVAISARPRINKRATVASGLTFSEDVHYVPVDDGPQALFVVLKGDQLDRARDELVGGEMVGMLDHAPLPDEATKQFRVIGRDVPERVWLLVWEATPPDGAANAFALWLSGALLLLVATAVIVLQRRARSAVTTSR